MPRTRHLVGLSIAIVALAGSLAPADPQPEDPNKALAREQLDIVQQALRDFDRLYKLGEVRLSDPRIALWERRQVEAIRTSGADKAEVIAALERHVERLKGLQSAVQADFMKGQISRVEVHDAKYRLLEAQIWLDQEKARKEE